MEAELPHRRDPDRLRRSDGGDEQDVASRSSAKPSGWSGACAGGPSAAQSDPKNQARMLPAGRTFYKMSGSGNDFVMVDAINNPSQDLTAADRVQSICSRGTGIGADGLVLLERSWAADFKMVYLNSDGSRADLCGNAALCSVRLAVELGIMPVGECHVETDAGVLSARLLPTRSRGRSQARRRREAAPAISARRRRAVDRLRRGRRPASRRARRRRGACRRGRPRAPSAVRQHRSRRARTSTSSHPTEAADGGSGPTSVGWRGRPWRAGPAPSRPPSRST